MTQTTQTIHDSSTPALREARHQLSTRLQGLDPRLGIGRSVRRTLRRVERELEQRTLKAERSKLYSRPGAVPFARSQISAIMRGNAVGVSQKLTKGELIALQVMAARA